MTDIHTHILPGMDDGAESIEESLKLLRLEVAGGVDIAALTPHYRADIEDISDFIARRQQSYKLLHDEVAAAGLPVRLKLGAEVAYSAQLAQMDIEALCYEGTRTILIELPVQYYPPFAPRVIDEIINKNYRVIIAHAERYPYFRKNTALLETLVQNGALTQINAGSVLCGGRVRKTIMNWVNSGLAHVIATDTHGIGRRPPELKKAVEYVKRKTGRELYAE